MKKLFHNKAFILGFWGGIGLFSLLNCLSLIVSYNEYQKRAISAGAYYIGFPFKANLTYIGNPSVTEILWVGVVADILIALICSFAMGLVFKFVLLKIASRPSFLK
jgi:hypothetical protein